MNWSAFLSVVASISIAYTQEHQMPNATELQYNKNKLVSHEIGGGRFGDQLLGYIHAKWISHYYKIPLLCNPFLYSDQLVLHEKELQAEGDTAHLLKHLKAYNTRDVVVQIKGMPHQTNEKPFHIVQTSYGMNVNYNSNQKELYWISYFPLSEWEITRNKDWYYFPIDWEDEEFLTELNRLIQPLHPLPKMSLPKNCLTTALHIRRGGGFDIGDMESLCPTKFPPMSYYIEQVRRIHRMFPQEALYIYVFTDDPNPADLAAKCQQSLSDLDIQFGYREKENHHASNVLEDFFAMMQFDCLIAADSNYSAIPARMIPYKVATIPLEFQKEDGTIYINKIQFKTDKKWSVL